MAGLVVMLHIDMILEQGHRLGRPPHGGHRTPHCSTVIVLLKGI